MLPKAFNSSKSNIWFSVPAAFHALGRGAPVFLFREFLTQTCLGVKLPVPFAPPIGSRRLSK